jgi:hypothetical protein
MSGPFDNLLRLQSLDEGECRNISAGLRPPHSIFTVYQSTPGQNFPKPLFVIHAYSLEQARALVAAKVAGETIVVGTVSQGGASR